ncbi:UDP-glucose 4-epimerase [Kineosphaera limosa]|uniref:Putative nucleotide-sugar epimerase n=1 Tax=Kineosphaera limosa NBRC 100340 TaxID=1184609 RepID=K6XCE4_9MICO|nr:NAD-dependent epimerase/dehydratase family protein [Kineosphaera limosa]NYE01722.1 UDP-glucose 4-epimerase [Kineosphaera limosa]GAB96479.1 putative nucleotide-sugar epimerase [Kineosphaera limosa NBRC 100340]
MTTVLVTGVSRFVGARVAQELSESPGVDRVIGIDLPEPRFPLGGADFVRVDIGNPLVGRILATQGVDVVVHLAMSADARSGAARVSQKERNVIGTMQLLATCQAHRPLRRFVLKSTASVYGSSPRDPAVFTEAMSGVGRIRGGHLRDAIEVEGYVRAMARRRPDLATVVLRMAHIVGPNVHSALTDYLRGSVWPTPLGFRARLQLLHPDDAITALVAAAVGTADGVVNVAGDGVVTLSQAARLLGRTAVPVPAATTRRLGSVLRRFGVAAMGDDQIDYLMWGRCLDTTRMRSLLHMEPAWSTRELIEDFGRPQEGPRDLPDFPEPAQSWAMAR